MERTVYDQDHQLFRDGVRAAVARVLVPELTRFREQGQIDRAAWRALGSAGYLGFMLPEQHGGGGMRDFRYNAVLGEELARLGVAVASSIGINTDIVPPYLMELATDEQAARWFPGMCDGTTITAIGMTEPSAGSDLAGMKTTAVRDGSDWILNGSKTFITNGARADLVVVAARTDPAVPKALTLFVLEAETPGFERGRKLDKIGQPEADTAELFFTDVRLPAGNVLGEVGGGMRAMLERLPQERMSAAITGVAHARHVLDLTLEYVKERRAFGQPVGSFQHNRFALADLDTSIDVTRAYVDQCLAAHVAGDLTPVEAAKAKLWATELQNRVADVCLQLHGGYGYMREYEVARAFVDARVTKIWAGTSEIMREIIGRSLGL